MALRFAIIRLWQQIQKHDYRIGLQRMMDRLTMIAQEYDMKINVKRRK